MNSPAHHLKKSFLYESHAVNYPNPSVSVNSSFNKRPSFNIRSENISIQLGRSKEYLNKNQHCYSNHINSMTSSVSSTGNRSRWNTQLNQDCKENNLEKKVNSMEIKLAGLLANFSKLQQSYRHNEETLADIKNLINNDKVRAQEIQSIRDHIQQLLTKNQMNKTLCAMQKGIKGAIVNINSSLCQQITQANEKQVKLRKKQIEKVVNNFEACLKENSEDIKMLKEKASWDSQKSYSETSIGKPLHLKIIADCIMKLECNSKEPLFREQIEYRIDQEGYLLDHQNRYLLNESKQQIKLKDHQIRQLIEKGHIGN